MEERTDEDYELFRRAILKREEEAWATIHARYRGLMVSWVSRYGANISAGEWATDIADHALARAWAALTPERFAEFPTLPRLLGHLRMCVVTTAIDSARALASSTCAPDVEYVDSSAAPEQAVLADLDREELWRIVIALASTEAERMVLVESFAYALPPRTIQARHPQLFPDVTAVYKVKRNICTRLQRNDDLQRLYDTFVSV